MTQLVLYGVVDAMMMNESTILLFVRYAYRSVHRMCNFFYKQTQKYQVYLNFHDFRMHTTCLFL